MRESFEVDGHDLLEEGIHYNKRKSQHSSSKYISMLSRLDESIEQSILFRTRGDIEAPHTGPMNQITIVSVFFICGVIIGGGTISPFTNLYHAPSPILMNCYRAIANFVVSLPVMIYLLYQDTRTRKLREIFTASTCQMILGVGCCFCIVSSCLIISSTLTVLSHSQVLGSLAGVLLIIYKMVTCGKLHSFEKIGAIMTIFGVLVLLSDKSAKKKDGRDASLWGEFFGFMVSVFYVLFFLINSVLVKRIHGLIVYNLMNLIVICILTTVFLLFGEASISRVLSMDPQVGIFGCFATEKLHVTLLVGLISGLFGNGSYIMITRYFEPHIASIFFLFQPVVSQILGLVLGLDMLPGTSTWLGFMITSYSIYLITQGSYQRIHDHHV